MKKMPTFTSKKKETFNLKQELFRYTRKWKWFVVSVAILLTAAFYMVRYSSTIYETTARIKIINQKFNEFELPGNLKSLFDDFKVNQENEIEILKSYRLLERVVERLDLNVRYYRQTKIKSVQVWLVPFKVHQIDTINRLPTKGEYLVTVLEDGYSIALPNGKKQWKVDTHNLEKAHEDLPFLIKTKEDVDVFSNIGNTFRVRFFTVKEATLRLLNGLKIEMVGKYSEILRLSLRNESFRKSEAILNEVIAQFNNDGLKDRKFIFQRTIDFVDERFEFLSRELDSIETEKKRFKEVNNLTDIELDTEHNLSDKANSKTERSNVETQLEIAKILKRTLLNKDEQKLLPADLGIGITGINDQIISYNQKLIEFKELKISAGENNPITKNLRKNINSLKQNILISVIAYQKKMEASLANIEAIDKQNKTFFKGIPGKEKILREIERRQTIKENLFIFLLQRREEAAINLNITAPTTKVVDFAITNLIPVSESPKMVYAKAFLAGLVLPFVVFYLIFFFDTKIHTKEQIYSNISKGQVVAEIPFSTTNKLFNGENDNSELAESFRVLRTNLNHNLKMMSLNKESTVLMTTSSYEEAGKTLCAINLAISYAVLKKKVLLIETNLREPKIREYVTVAQEGNIGLSGYLKNDIHTLKDITITCQIKEARLDVIYAGESPGSPAELLSNGRLEDLVEEAKSKYDFIVLDTPPTSEITDTLLISDIPDVTLYIVRSGYSDKKALRLAEELRATEKLQNVSYVLNAKELDSMFRRNSRMYYIKKFFKNIFKKT